MSDGAVSTIFCHSFPSRPELSAPAKALASSPGEDSRARSSASGVSPLRAPGACVFIQSRSSFWKVVEPSTVSKAAE